MSYLDRVKWQVPRLFGLAFGLSIPYAIGYFTGSRLYQGIFPWSVLAIMFVSWLFIYPLIDTYFGVVKTKKAD